MEMGKRENEVVVYIELYCVFLLLLFVLFES